MTALDRRVEELAAQQHGVFTTRQVLLREGNHDQIRARVDSGRWHRDGRGILRLVGAPVTPRSTLAGIVASSGGRAVVSHETAAWLHELPGFSPAVLSVTIPRGTRLEVRPGLVVHRSNCMPSRHRTTIDALPVGTIARTLFELTAVCRLGRAARAMDTALARRRADYAGLACLLGDVSRQGRRRTRWFRALLQERGPLYVPPASELERRFIDLIAQHGLGRWSRQVPLGDTHAWHGRVDFYRRDARLIVEVDGKVAHSALLDRIADEERAHALEASGFDLLRFGWAEVVSRPAAVAATIRGRLESPTTRT